MIRDPIVEEVRTARKTIETACGNDPAKYVARLRQLEKKHAARLVTRGPKPTPAIAESRVTHGN